MRTGITAVNVLAAAFLVLLAAGQVQAHVALDFPNGGQELEAGSVVQVVWHDVVNHGSANFDLWYSVTGPDGPWIGIADNLPSTGSESASYDWVVPDTPSDQVRVRVRQDNDEDQDYYSVSDSDLAIVSASATLLVVLGAERDATIYEEDGGTGANGSGSYLFAGRTAAQNGSAERRALLAFPISGAIPAGTTITSVTLELTMSRTISGDQTVGVHRLLEDWSEGASDPPGQEGGGSSASAGDVTWMHRAFPGTLWATPGGSFEQSASATVQVGGVASYTIESTPELVEDVQDWLADSATNFGWMIVVDSPPSGSAKRFNSRDSSSVSSRPQLTIRYEAGQEAPVADFSFVPGYPGPGEEIQFNDHSTGSPTSWAWDFGDGQTSQEQSPTHTFGTSGSMTVTLVVSNAAGTDSIVKNIRVGPTIRRPSRRQTPGS